MQAQGFFVPQYRVSLRKILVTKKPPGLQLFKSDLGYTGKKLRIQSSNVLMPIKEY